MGELIDIDALFSLKDKYGNRMFCQNGIVELRLKKEDGRRRMIGKIIDGPNGLEYRKAGNEKNVFKKMDAWGVNSYILARVDYVVITTKDAIYSLNAKEGALLGKTLGFKQQGFELQTFIKRANWDKELTSRGKAKEGV